MDCPLYLGDRRVGILRATPAGTDTCFALESSAPPDLYRVWACGGRGEALLGIWAGGPFRRRLSRRLTAPAEPVICGRLRPSPRWEWRPARPEDCPGPPAAGGLCRRLGEAWELALPFGEDGPFPVPELFCLARTARIAGRRYAVFRFDAAGRPLPPEK